MSKTYTRGSVAISDGIAALLGWICFAALRHFETKGTLNSDGWFSWAGSGVFIALCWVVLYAFFGFYIRVEEKSRAREFFTLLWICLLGLVVLFAALLLDSLSDGQDPTLGELGSWFRNLALYFPIHFFFASSFKLIALSRIKSLIHSGKIFFPALLVGGGPNAQELFEELEKHNKYLGLKIKGFVSVNSTDETSTIDGLSKLGDLSALETLILNHQVEHCLLAIEPSEHRKIEGILNQIEGTGARAFVIPDIYQILLGSVKVSNLLGSPLIEVKQNLMPIWQWVTKRFIDVIMSLTVLILGSPMYLLVAVITKFTSKGPIFFSQERIGKGGKPFLIYKFRSMYTHAEAKGPALSSDNDPRVTPWGRFMRKTRIDEFPQFFNVLIGDMSLVGPRPERQFFIDQIVKVAPHYKHLNRVRPGITSLGQVKYGYASNVEQMVRRLKFDILYIENMSIAMDLKIMFYTIITMLKGSGK